MSIYITPQDELHVEYQGIALTCPHCQTLTHLTPMAVPKFEELSRRKPKHIGIVFRCDTCIEPIFLKFAVKPYTALRGVLFGSDSERWPHHPILTWEHAGILLEVMRDLLYQTFVRKARLIQAVTFRRFVAPNQAEVG